MMQLRHVRQRTAQVYWQKSWMASPYRTKLLRDGVLSHSLLLLHLPGQAHTPRNNIRVFADPVLCKCWRMTDACVRIYITFDVLAWVRPSSESANFIPRWRPDPGRNVGRNEYFCMSVTYIYGRLAFKHQSMKKLFFYLILFSFVWLTVIRDMYRFAVTGFYCATQGRVQHSFVLTVCAAPSVLYLSLGHISLA